MSEQKKMPVMVLAIGGNALIEDNHHVDIDSQRIVAAKLAVDVVNLIEAGWRVVLTHGNGPHVGIHLVHDAAVKEFPLSPLDHHGAATQGQIGYLLQSAIGNELLKRGINMPVVSVVTQVEVDATDSAFLNPNKPVGIFMEEMDAKAKAAKEGWKVVEDSGRGWRRVVPSPTPKKIIELDIIKQLVNSGALVIACGGGGIPVKRNADNTLTGAEAVIDKDRVSSLLAADLNADVYLIPTGVEQIAVNFGQPNQEWLSELSVADAEKYKAEGQFPAGSMLPKVESLLDYIAACPHGIGIVTKLDTMADALKGTKGTRIYQ